LSARNAGRWVWRCHVDCSSARADTWAAFRQFADQYDAAVFSLPGFESRLDIPMFVVAPSIDPFAERNRDLTAREITEILGGLGVARDKPLLVQIGPFTRAHDPLGVVDAYRLVKQHHDVRLALAGTADDEPERLELLTQLREIARDDPDVAVLELPAEAPGLRARLVQRVLRTRAAHVHERAEARNAGQWGDRERGHQYGEKPQARGDRDGSGNSSTTYLPSGPRLWRRPRPPFQQADGCRAIGDLARGQEGTRSSATGYVAAPLSES
jgi:hypothetical protein